jgi:hypothetical protein
MAEADLDIVIRSIAKKQIKTLTDAAKKRHGRFMGMAAKAKDKESRNRYRHLAKTTQLLAAAAAASHGRESGRQQRALDQESGGRIAFNKACQRKTGNKACQQEKRADVELTIGPMRPGAADAHIR